MDKHLVILHVWDTRISSRYPDPKMSPWLNMWVKFGSNHNCIKKLDWLVEKNCKFFLEETTDIKFVPMRGNCDVSQHAFKNHAKYIKFMQEYSKTRDWLLYTYLSPNDFVEFMLTFEGGNT